MKKAPWGGSKDYLIKIIEYCQDKNIPITLFVSPMDNLRLISTEGYDLYVDQIKGIAREYGIEFYDFNLVKDEYLHIHEGGYFSDSGHMNSFGAEIFTPFFAKVVSGDYSENEKYFYSSYAEKLEREAPSLYGIYYRELETIKTFWIASNRNSGMEYRIILSPDDGEQLWIQDFSENKEFTVPANEHGICTIVARTAESPDEVQTLEINY